MAAAATPVDYSEAAAAPTPAAPTGERVTLAEYRKRKRIADEQAARATAERKSLAEMGTDYNRIDDYYTNDDTVYLPIDFNLRFSTNNELNEIIQGWKDKIETYQTYYKELKECKYILDSNIKNNINIDASVQLLINIDILINRILERIVFSFGKIVFIFFTITIHSATGKIEETRINEFKQYMNDYNPFISEYDPQNMNETVININQNIQNIIRINNIKIVTPEELTKQRCDEFIKKLTELHTKINTKKIEAYSIKDTIDVPFANNNMAALIQKKTDVNKELTEARSEMNNFFQTDYRSLGCVGENAYPIMKLQGECHNLIKCINIVYNIFNIAIYIMEIANEYTSANIELNTININQTLVLIRDVDVSNFEQSDKDIINSIKANAEKMSIIFVKLTRLFIISDINAFEDFINTFSQDTDNITNMLYKMTFFKFIGIVVRDYIDNTLTTVLNTRNFNAYKTDMGKYYSIIEKLQIRLYPNINALPELERNSLKLIILSNNVIKYLAEYNDLIGGIPTTSTHLETLARNLLQTHTDIRNFHQHIETNNQHDPMINNIVKLRQITTGTDAFAKNIIIERIPSTLNLWAFINAIEFFQTLINRPEELKTDLSESFISSTTHPDTITQNTLGRYGIIIDCIKIGRSTRTNERGLYFTLRIGDLLERSLDPAIRAELNRLYPHVLSPEPFPHQINPSCPQNRLIQTNVGAFTYTNTLVSALTYISDFHISIHDYNQHIPSYNQSHIKFIRDRIEYNYVLYFSLDRKIDSTIISISGKQTLPILSASTAILNIDSLATCIATDMITGKALIPSIHYYGIKNALLFFLDDLAKYLSRLSRRYMIPPFNATAIMNLNAPKNGASVSYQKYIKYKTKYLELLKKINKN